MKERKKQKIKRFYKKSVWPSVALFLIFMGSCVGMVMTSLFAFQGNLMDSKIADIHDDAKKLGRIVDSHMGMGDIYEIASFLMEYVGEENDICVTDRNNQILRQFGEAEPDFSRADDVRLFHSYRIIPDRDFAVADGERALLISLPGLFKQSMGALERSGYVDDRWMEEQLFYAHYWVEIPVRAREFHLYYRDSVTILQKDVFFMNLAILLELLLLAVPTFLLFVNVLSSIAMQKRMVHLIYLDPVTGGRNWSYFVTHSKKILCRFRNASHTYAMVNLRMNRYQDYCTCYGSKVGDELLQKIDGFLQVNMDRGETFARFAKSDFGLLLHCTSVEQCERRLKKMLVQLTGIKKDKMVSFCAGLYLIEPVTNKKERQRRQIDIDQIYSYASAARGTLRIKEGEHIKVFDQQILEGLLWKHKVEETMEAALLGREFQLYLQPKYNPVTEKIVGAEALVRWVSPTDGMIPPNRFIPIFEENGFITRLDDYMISAVAKLQSEWKIQGKKSVPVSVNVSRVNFVKEDLAGHICHLVDGYGADHASIELELTESAFFGNKDLLQKILKELKMYGFHISMDDFGAGYSSLNSLKDLPIDVLKLDMDFFRGDVSGKRGEIVVKETIRLAKELDMKIVAEGIERREQVEFLAEQGCDMIQGYYFAKPMTVSEFNERVECEC